MQQQQFLQQNVTEINVQIDLIWKMANYLEGANNLTAPTPSCFLPEINNSCCKALMNMEWLNPGEIILKTILTQHLENKAHL